MPESCVDVVPVVLSLMMSLPFQAGKQTMKRSVIGLTSSLLDTLHSTISEV